MTRSQAALLMVVVTLLWSLAGIVSRQITGAAGFEVTFWRSIFNALALGVLLSVWRGRQAWRSLLVAPALVWLSAVCWAIMFTAFMLAITRTSVANVLIIMAFGPLLTALLARLWHGQHLASVTWVAIGTAAVGMVGMFAHQIDGGISMRGSAVALAVPLAASVNWNILYSGSAESLSAQEMLPALWVGACLSALVTLPWALPFQATVADIRWLAFLGVFQLALPCGLVVLIGRILPGPEVALWALLEVIFGIAWAWLGADERPDGATLSGGGLVVGALLLNAYFTRTPGDRPLAQAAR